MRFLLGVMLLGVLGKAAMAQHAPLPKGLEGTWRCTFGKGTLTEKWVSIADTAYLARTHVVEGADTTFAEIILLSPRKRTYVVKLKDKTEPFSITAMGDSLVMTSPTNEYPNRIVYRRTHADTLLAVTSGLRKGKPSRMVFKLGRVK